MEARDYQANRPPLNWNIVLVQLAAGCAGVFIGGIIAVVVAVVLALITADPRAEGLEALLAFIVFGYTAIALYLVLGTVASAGGVYYAGSRAEQTASFWWTLAGSVLQTAFFVGLAALALKANLSPALGALVGNLFVIPAGAGIGFNLTRRYKAASR